MLAVTSLTSYPGTAFSSLRACVHSWVGTASNLGTNHYSQTELPTAVRNPVICYSGTANSVTLGLESTSSQTELPASVGTPVPRFSGTANGVTPGLVRQVELPLKPPIYTHRCYSVGGSGYRTVASQGLTTHPDLRLRLPALFGAQTPDLPELP